MDRKRQPSNNPVTPAAMSQSRFLDPASVLFAAKRRPRSRNVSTAGSCRKCRCQEGALASRRRSETATPKLKGRRSVGPALVGCLHLGLSLGPFAPLLATTLVYAEKVRPQFLSLRQLAQGRVFSGRTRWQLSPVAVAISNLSSGLPNRHNRPIILRKAGFSPNLRTPTIRYGSRNLIVSSYLSASAESGSAVSLG
jgi:hypothetical protein